MYLYPIFLKLENKSCVVIGGGKVAERKTRDLLEAGAKITLISPDLTPGLEKMIHCGNILYKPRKYKPGDLKRALLVIAATNASSVNKQLHREAERRGLLLNAVDNPENCDFFVPARVCRGPLQLAVSTSGKLPLLARKLKEYLEKKFRPGLEADLEALARKRTRIIENYQNPRGKNEAIRRDLLPAVEEFIEGIESYDRNHRYQL